MSKVKIEGNASGTGTLTISAPNTNTDRTLTLPDGAGEILTDASTLSSSNLSGALPAIDGSALTGIDGGKVVQVVHSSYSTQKSWGGTTPLSTGLSGSITPTSASNKILVMVNQHLIVSTDTADIRVVYLKVRRGGTNLALYEYLVESPSSTRTWQTFGTYAQFLDSPATTSSVTYETDFYLNNGACDVYTQYANEPTSITMMEIAV